MRLIFLITLTSCSTGKNPYLFQSNSFKNNEQKIPAINKIYDSKFAGPDVDSLGISHDHEIPVEANNIIPAWKNSVKNTKHDISLNSTTFENRNEQPKFFFHRKVKMIIKEPKEKKITHKLGLLSFIAVLFAPLTLGISGVAGFVLGIIALEQIKKNPTKYKNQWMPVLGIILGGIVIFILLLLALFTVLLTNTIHSGFN